MIDLKSDKKFIINLPKRTDRKLSSLMQLSNLKIENYEFIEAVDGETLEQPTKHKKGALGCKLSHLIAIQKAKDNKLPHCIILEDDCDIDQHILVKFANWQSQIPNDWELLYLGAHNNRPLRMISDNIGKCITSLSTIAYIVRDSIYDLLLTELQEDEILDIKYVNLIHFGKIKGYCVSPNLVVQKAGFSNIEGMNVNYSKYYRK